MKKLKPFRIVVKAWYVGTEMNSIAVARGNM